jgi:hypothetical protein
MSTKRVFDEAYLYLKSIHTKYFEGKEGFEEMDSRESYQEVANKYWNLIYKHNPASNSE